MSEILRPQNDADIVEVVQQAAAEKVPLEVAGRGSKRALGRPLQTAGRVELSALSGITLYEPEELVLQALPGTPMAEIEQVLADNHQLMAFEPPDFGPLLGGAGGDGSIGGTLACNLAGPRRLKAGAARDHFLGVTAVSGRGEVFKAGGRVVKNVTGYDLMKLLTGSYGTLAVMTEVTIKVLPRPEKTYSLLLYELDTDQATRAMTRALSSSHEVSGAAHLPAQLAGTSKVSYVNQAGAPVTAIRLEGPGPSVQHRIQALSKELSDLGTHEALHSQNSLAFWSEVRDVLPLVAPTDRLIWRLSVPPAAAAEIVSRIMQTVDDCFYFLDWGGGLIWLSLPPADDGHAAAVRGALGNGDGHATLFRAPENIRAAVPVFQPQAAPLAALSQRLKQGFDPLGLLNPGRIYQDI